MFWLFGQAAIATQVRLVAARNEMQACVIGFTGRFSASVTGKARSAFRDNAFGWAQLAKPNILALRRANAIDPPDYDLLKSVLDISHSVAAFRRCCDYPI